MRRNDLDLRWVDGREALFFPRGRQLICREQTLLPPVLQEVVEPNTRRCSLDFGKMPFLKNSWVSVGSI